MGIAFYMDENIDGAIAQGLRRRGVDVITIQEDGLMSASDPVMLDRALALGRIVFTHDDDFLRETQRRQATGESFAGVAYAHLQGPGIGRCIADLELMAKVY